MSREGPRLLFCAFAEVPGASAIGVRLTQVLGALPEGLEVDALCLKGEEQPHIQRLGPARTMRVPVLGETFEERLGGYQRALSRQLAGEVYDLVWCGDLCSAQLAQGFSSTQGFALVVEPAELSPQAAAARGKAPTKKAAAERAVLRAAAHVIAPSRHAARLLTSLVDARRLQLVPRAVDRAVFAPPTVEIALGGRLRVAVLGGREGEPMLSPVLDLLAGLHEAIGGDGGAALALIGSPGGADDAVRLGLERRRLTGVELVDAEDPQSLASALAEADVVVVPSAAEHGQEPLAVPHRALESMACRRATVITGPERVFADALVPQQDALVVPARSPAALAKAVARLLEGPALRESVAQAGARRVEQEADLVTRQGEVLAFLSDAMGRALEATQRREDEPSEPSLAGVGLPALVDQESNPGGPARERTESGPSPAPISSVFTSEAPSELPPAPKAPPGLPADDTVVAPPPSGFESDDPRDARPPPYDGAPPDDWDGDTRIDPSTLRFEPTPREEVDPEADTVRPATAPHLRTLAVEVTHEGTSEPEGGDPWVHDTIADASPVFSADDTPRQTSTPATPLESGASRSGASFLVDRELVDEPTGASPVDDLTVDEEGEERKRKGSASGSRD